MKYFSHKVKHEGETFDSKKELGRYLQLCILQTSGCISNLRRQVRFEILPRLDRLETVHLKTKDKIVVRCEEKAKYYTADFVYYDEQKKKNIIEDVKSLATAGVRDYPLRRHLMKMLVDRLNDECESGLWEFKEVL